MDWIDKYREQARRTRDIQKLTPRAREDRIKHWTIGLTGEAGEVSNVVKKHVCTNKRDFFNTREMILDESGDVLWYLDALLDEYDLDLRQVGDFNINKLAQRHGITA